MHAYIKSMAMPIEQTVSQYSIVFAHACIRMLLFNIERLLLCALWWCLCKQVRLSCLVLSPAANSPVSPCVCIGQRALASQILNSCFSSWHFYPKTYLLRLLKIFFSTLVMWVVVQSFSLRLIILILQKSPQVGQNDTDLCSKWCLQIGITVTLKQRN